jgi:Uma2 family endonuclease
MTTVHAAVPLAVLEQFASGQAPAVEPLTISQVEEMMKHGILREGAPLELIDGLLVHKDRSARGEDPMTHNPAHANCVSRLLQVLAIVQANGFHLRCQTPIALSPTRAPEPDIAILRGMPADYRGRHPGPADIAAVFEVADSSLQFDRVRKLQLYAAAGIPVYWIANLIDNVIEVYQRPDLTAGKYAAHAEFRSGDILELTLSATVAFALRADDILE